MFVAFNCGTTGSARGDYSECEPEWYNNRPESGTDEYYGVGIAESKSRSGVKTAAVSRAGREVLSQLKSFITADIEANIYDNLATVDEEEVRDFSERIIDNLVVSLQGNCEECVVVKFADCEENNVWTAYALVKFDVVRWKKSKFRAIADEALEKSSEKLKSQSEKFRKRFGIE